MKKGSGWFLLYPVTIGIFLICTYIGSQAVTTFAENAHIEREVCIIIDPGHGGVDGGATSCTGILESQINLEMALRINDLFQLLGYETRMIRDQDVSIYTKGETISQKKISDLKERVRIVNETPNALLISIHQNHYTDQRYRGAQVFYPPTDKSDILANTLQTAFSTSIDPNNHRHSQKAKGIYLMEHIHCTGVLIECGFLSNPEEEQKLRNGTYQKMLSAVIVTTVDRFLSNT